MIIRVWNVETGEETKVLRAHEDWITRFEISQDGRWIASGSFDGTTRLWDLRSKVKEPPGLILAKTAKSIEGLATSPDSRWLAAGLMDAIHVWDLSDPDPISTQQILYGPIGEVGVLAFTPDARRLIGGSDDKTVRIRQLDPDGWFAPLEILRGHEEPLRVLKVDPKGQWVVTGGRTLRRWNFTEHNLVETFPRVPTRATLGYKPYIVLDVALSKDDRWLASADNGKGVRLWSMDRLNAAPDVLLGHSSDVSVIEFESSGRYLFSGSYDGTVRRWDLMSQDRRGETIIELDAGHDIAGHDITSISVDDPADYIYVVEVGGRILLWQHQPAQVALVGEIQVGRSLGDARLATRSDGTRIWTENSDGELVEWRTTPGSIERLGAIDQLDHAISALTLTDQNSLLAVASAGIVYVYRASDGKLTKLWELTGASRGVSDLAFSHDGQWLYAGDDNRSFWAGIWIETANFQRSCYEDINSRGSQSRAMESN